MRKPPTGEPCAGEPQARFGGRGGVTLPDPYLLCKRKTTDMSDGITSVDVEIEPVPQNDCKLKIRLQYLYF